MKEQCKWTRRKVSQTEQTRIQRRWWRTNREKTKGGWGGGSRCKCGVKGCPCLLGSECTDRWGNGRTGCSHGNTVIIRGKKEKETQWCCGLSLSQPTLVHSTLIIYFVLNTSFVFYFPNKFKFIFGKYVYFLFSLIMK